MPDSKITALTSISTSTDPANDPLVIVDVSDTSMAATGTTKKVTLNQLLGASGTATLASATITGDLTVDTSTLKVDSANNRVGIGTASPALPLEIYKASGDSKMRITSGANSLTIGWDDPNGFYYTANTSLMAWQLSGTTAMTLNTTGLGVGVASPNQPIQLSKSNTSTALTAPPTGGASLRIQNTSSTNNNFGSVEFYNAAGLFGASINCQYTNQATPTNDLVFVVRGSGGGIEAARIDSSGNVGIGVTPANWATIKALQVGSGASLFGYTATEATLSGNTYYNAGFKYVANGQATQYQQQIGEHRWYTAPSGTAGNAISFTQAMTLDASGNLLVGKTASNSTVVGAELRPSGAIISTLAASTNADFALYTYSTGAGAARFYVGMSGTVFATNTTISAISDARLKENVQDIDVGLGAILALKPRKFDWKAGKGKDIKGDRGFIAQEFEQVFPQLVDQWADEAPEGEAPYKSVRQDLIPVLVKAIQELTARVQTLETR